MEAVRSYPGLTKDQRKVLGGYMKELGADASVTNAFKEIGKNDIPASALFLLRRVIEIWMKIEGEEEADRLQDISFQLDRCQEALGRENRVLQSVLQTFVIDGPHEQLLHRLRSPLAVCIRDTLVHYTNRAKEVYDMLGDDTTPPAAPIPGSCNPPREAASYSFTEHGQRVRQLQEVTELSGTADDDNTSDGCSKTYAHKSNKSYVMLFFCPIHGHCYGMQCKEEAFFWKEESVRSICMCMGVFLLVISQLSSFPCRPAGFHIIAGGEGRKDVHDVLFQYLDKAPSIVLYDAACLYTTGRWPCRTERAMGFYPYFPFSPPLPSCFISSQLVAVLPQPSWRVLPRHEVLPRCELVARDVLFELMPALFLFSFFFSCYCIIFCFLLQCKLSFDLTRRPLPRSSTRSTTSARRPFPSRTRRTRICRPSTRYPQSGLSIEC